MTNRFVFVVPVFNAGKTLARMLHSVCGQSYENWRVVLIDDVSSDADKRAEQRIIRQFKDIIDDDPADDMFEDLKRSRIVSLWNTEKQWEVANVLQGISLCEPDDIVCRLDGDDFLCDLDALRIIDNVYQQGYDCVWSAHRWHDERAVTSHNISAAMPDNADPYVHPWVSSHLKTFRKHLLDDVKDVNFRGEDGEYIKRCGDQAIYLPALHNAKKRGYLPLVAYSYKCDMSPATFQTVDAKFQRDEGLFLRKRGYVP